MQLQINGNTEQVPDTLTIEGLLNHLGYEPKSIAVAIDGEFVPRNLYGQRSLQTDEVLDIVAPMQGG